MTDGTLELHDSSTLCPHCGRRFKLEERTRRRRAVRARSGPSMGVHYEMRCRVTRRLFVVHTHRGKAAVVSDEPLLDPYASDE